MFASIKEEVCRLNHSARAFTTRKSKSDAKFRVAKPDPKKEVKNSRLSCARFFEDRHKVFKINPKLCGANRRMRWFEHDSEGDVDKKQELVVPNQEL